VNEKEGGHAIGQVGFWDKMNAMRELRGIASPMNTSSCDNIVCICFRQNESGVNLNWCPYGRNRVRFVLRFEESSCCLFGKCISTM